MRNRTSDLRIPRSNALPLSHRDSTVSEVGYEVFLFFMWKASYTSLPYLLYYCARFLTVYKNGFIILFCCCCFFFFLSYADECQEPLGIEDPDIIEDGQLTASSAWEDDHDKFGAQRGRLNLNRWPQGWTASVEDRSPWFQVNLKHPFIITRMATQGYGGSVDQWVEKYRVSWKSEEEDWRNYSVPRQVKTSAVLWKNKVIITC